MPEMPSGGAEQGSDHCLSIPLDFLLSNFNPTQPDQPDLSLYEAADAPPTFPEVPHQAVLWHKEQDQAIYLMRSGAWGIALVTYSRLCDWLGLQSPRAFYATRGGTFVGACGYDSRWQTYADFLPVSQQPHAERTEVKNPSDREDHVTLAFLLGDRSAALLEEGFVMEDGRFTMCATARMLETAKLARSLNGSEAVFKLMVGAGGEEEAHPISANELCFGSLDDADRGHSKRPRGPRVLSSRRIKGLLADLSDAALESCGKVPEAFGPGWKTAEDFMTDVLLRVRHSARATE